MGELGTWGKRLIAGLAVGLALASLRAWLGIFYLGQPVNEILIWKADDAPGLPRALYQPVKLFGNHYFGDFQEGISWGVLLVERHLSPYIDSVSYLPAAVLPFAALALLPLKASFAVYVSAMALGLLVPIWLMTAPIRTSERVLILCLLGTITVPFLAVLDRGNLQGFVSAAVGFGLWAASKHRWSLMAGLLVLAICLKGYPIVLLVIPLAYRKWRLAAIVTLMAGVISSLLFAIMPGGLFENIRNYLTALATFSGQGLPTHNYSFVGAIHQLVALRIGDSEVSGWLSTHSYMPWLIALGWLLLIWVIIVGRRVPQWCWGPLALASLQVVAPISYAYTLGWAGLAGVWFIRGNLIPDSPNPTGKDPVVLAPWAQLTLRVLTMGTLLVTLTPIGIMVTNGTVSTSFAPILSPGMIAVTGLVALVMTLSSRVVSPAHHQQAETIRSGSVKRPHHSILQPRNGPLDTARG